MSEPSKEPEWLFNGSDLGDPSSWVFLNLNLVRAIDKWENNTIRVWFSETHYYTLNKASSLAKRILRNSKLSDGTSFFEIIPQDLKDKLL